MGSETVGRLMVECPGCGETVEVDIEARTYPVNEVGQMRVGIGVAPEFHHVCQPVPPGPGDGERVAA